MNIRDAVKNDFPRLDELYEQVDELHRRVHPDRFKKPEKTGRSADYYESLLDTPGAFLIVVEKEGKVIGFAEAYIKKAKNNPVVKPRTWLLIDGIVIDKVWRNSGAGQFLLNELVRRAKAGGIDQIELNVYEFNTAAIKFYEKCGFKSICKTMHKNI